MADPIGTSVGVAKVNPRNAASPGEYNTGPAGPDWSFVPQSLHDSEADLNKRAEALTKLQDDYYAARDAYDKIDKGSASAEEISNARARAGNALDNYLKESNNITSQRSAIERIKQDYWDTYQKSHPELTPEQREAARIELENAREQSRAAVLANEAAQAAATQASAVAEYEAAKRAGYPAAKLAEYAQRVDAAKATADELNNTIKQAQADNAAGREGSAARNDAATATTSEANATTAQAQAARAPETVAQTLENLVQSGRVTRATADELIALLPEKVLYASAQRENLGANTTLTQQQAATEEALRQGKVDYSQAQLEGQRLQNHQLQVGDVQTKREQLAAAVAGGMDPAQADQIMEDFLSGSTSFQRRQQREAQVQHATDTALSYGMAVRPGQQYVAGFEPGGAFSGAQAMTGAAIPTVQINDAQPLQQWLGGQGIQTADQPAPQRFAADGSYTAQPQPVVPGVTHAPVPVVSAAQVLAELQGAQQQPQPVQQAQPATPVQQQPQAAAQGGTFMMPMPRAMTGIKGHTPKVEKPPLFAESRTKSKKASLFGKGH